MKGGMMIGVATSMPSLVLQAQPPFDGWGALVSQFGLPTALSVFSIYMGARLYLGLIARNEKLEDRQHEESTGCLVKVTEALARNTEMLERVCRLLESNST